MQFRLFAPVKKGDLINSLKLESMASEGKCVSRLDGRVVFVTGGAPGDVVTVRVTKIKSSFLEAVVENVEQPSDDRVDPFCRHFGLCGGCSWQHIRYDVQLRYKQQQVIDHLERIGGLELHGVRPILGSGQTQGYRNRLDFTCTASRWMTREELDLGAVMGQPGIGFHIPRMYDRVFDLEHCHLMPEPVNAIRNRMREVAIQAGITFFDLRRQVGWLRTITVRQTSAGDIMLIVQVAYDEPEWLETILVPVRQEFPQVTSIQYIINGKRNDTFHDQDIVVWHGSPFITEEMPRPVGDGILRFRIGPKSFYQTNSRQASVLYRATWELAGLTGRELVYDLYTGTGTIANYIAREAKRVVGIEYVDAAVVDARINSGLNGNSNTEFHAGDMKDLLREDFLAVHGRPDVVITDPPRAGMHEDVVDMILKAAPERVVYVSCNAATQARDIRLMAERYMVSAVQPVDMFPQTMHVENIVRLDRRS